MTDNPRFWQSFSNGCWQSKNCFESVGADFAERCCWQKSCYMQAMPNSLTCERHVDLEQEARDLAAHSAAYALGAAE